MSLLTICQDAADELGLGDVPSLVGNPAPDARLLLRLARKDAAEIARRAFWTFLRQEHTFTVQAGDGQGVGSLPADLECFVPETMYDRTTRRLVDGPMSPQDWQRYKASLIVPAEPRWLQRGAELLMTTPRVGNLIAYEYISTLWARSDQGVEQETFLADTDRSIWPDDIHTQGLIWRFRKHKGLAFEDERLEYERMVADRIMRDGGKPRLDTGVTDARSGRGRAGMPDYNTIPVS